MHIDVLYNKQFDTTTFYVYRSMDLVDKKMYPGVLSNNEIKAIKERIVKEKTIKL